MGTHEPSLGAPVDDLPALCLDLGTDAVGLLEAPFAARL
jgi:hypothetical protein